SRTALARLNRYRATRIVAERLVQDARGAEVAVARPKTFIGAGRVGAFALVFEQIRTGRAVPMPGAGAHRYQLLGAADLADGLCRLATMGGTGTFWFGAERFGTVAEDLQELVCHAGTGARLRPVKGWWARRGLRLAELVGLSPLSEWYQCGLRGRDSVVEIARSCEELGWRPELSNSQALVGAYDWFSALKAQGAPAPATHPVPRSHRLLGTAISVALR
ncbi:MAG: NAD-dependent epimerase/dehydratase family protein, partial [Anaerolineales bacterium]